MNNLDSAMTKLDAAGLTEDETHAVRDFLATAMSQDGTDEAEVAGFGMDPVPRGFLLEVAGIKMRPNQVQSFTATDDLARVNSYTDAGRVT